MDVIPVGVFLIILGVALLFLVFIALGLVLYVSGSLLFYWLDLCAERRQNRSLRRHVQSLNTDADLIIGERESS